MKTVNECYSSAVHMLLQECSCDATYVPTTAVHMHAYYMS